MLELYIGSSSPTKQKCFLWNMAGSFMFALSSMVLSLFVIRIVGTSTGGLFAIALTISQLFMFIAFFEMRNFQVTDAKFTYKFGEYHSAKLLMCLAMIIVCAIYVVLVGYEGEKAIIVLLVCLYRLFDAYADVYESQFQADGRLDLAGKSMTFRTLFSVSALFVALALSGQLIFSLVVANISAFVFVILFDVVVMKKISRVSFSKEFSKIKEIIIQCTPLFIGVFCWSYIMSVSRIAIDAHMESQYQSYFTLIFLPVSVISLFAGFLFRPLLPKLAFQYDEGKVRGFFLVIAKGLAVLAGLTVISMFGAYIIGIPVLSFLSGADLGVYRNLLVFLILAGGVNALGYTLYLVLTIMRASKSILIGYVLSAIFAFVVVSPLVRELGMSGAALGYFLVVSLLVILFSGQIGLKFRKKKRKKVV